MEKQYFITDGYKFVKQNANSNKYVFTSSQTLADTWESFKVAEAIINNSLPVAVRSRCYVACMEGDNVVPITLSSEEKKERRERVSTPNPENKSYALEQYSFDSDNSLQNIVEAMENARNVITYAQNQYRALEDRLVYLDFVDEDLKHYLARKKINARDGYKLTKMRQNVVLERISLKNKLEVVKKIREKYGAIFEPVDEICKTIENLRNQRYKPRVLINLFENGKIDGGIGYEV